MITSGGALGMAICEALKLDAHMISKITISVEATERGVVSTVHIERGLTEDEAGTLKRILSKYTLVEDPSEPTHAPLP